MKLKLLLTLCILLVLVSGCDETYTQEQFEEIYEKCREEGNIPTYFFNDKEDMTIDEAIDICDDLIFNNNSNKTIEEKVDERSECVHNKHNYIPWIEAVKCFELDKKFRYIKIYGNCSYVKEHLIKKGWFFTFYNSKCN